MLALYEHYNEFVYLPRSEEETRSAKLTVFCEIDAKLRNHHIIRISPVQLILRNCEISSVDYQNFPCSTDFAKLRNQFSLLSELSNVQVILRNCKISSVYYQNVQCSVDFAKLGNCEISSVYYQKVQCSVDFAKLRNQFSLLQNVQCSVDFAKLRNQFSLLSEFLMFS